MVMVFYGGPILLAMDEKFTSDCRLFHRVFLQAPDIAAWSMGISPAATQYMKRVSRTE
jgi:hypothetical protein